MSTSKIPVLQAFLDSGAPQGIQDYITLVLLHGVMWHGANFKRLLPLAAQHNSRVIALNRRDYPGSAAYTAEERALMEQLAASAPGPAETHERAWDLMRERAREVYDYLVDLVKRERIPPKRGAGTGASGGIVLVGWSLAGQWMLAFMAHAPSFDSHDDDVQLSRYVRKVILYDSAVGLGTLPSITNSYHPFHDPETPPDSRVGRFNEWATRYFEHGEPITEETLAMRDFLEDPPSTLNNMTPEERRASTHEDPGRIPDGSDTLIAKAIAVGGIAPRLKDAALYLPAEGAGGWSDVDAKLVWCDRSIWITVWAARNVAKDIQEAKDGGRPLRKLSLVRLRGANHFAHWDMPAETLRVFLE